MGNGHGELAALVERLAAGGGAGLLPPRLVEGGRVIVEVALRDVLVLPGGQIVSVLRSGADVLPQTTIIPLCDIVFTHGGNNTTTEAMHFGKPMVLLPVFWDQHDNAQRVHELGFGQRLDTYTSTDADLRDAVDGLAADVALRERMASIGATIRANDGKRHAADLIESIGRSGRDR